VANGTPCDDGLFCTVENQCADGLCTGDPRDCSELSDQCNLAICNNASAICEAMPLPDSTPCDDGSFCTVDDRCVTGQCLGGTPRDCSEGGDGCQVWFCNDASAICESDPLPDGTLCDDGLFCTLDDQCTEGACGGAPRDCSDEGDQCNDGVCNESTGACEAQPKSDGTACDDGLFCTVNDQCTGGACEGAPRDCSAEGDQCNDGVCNEAANACEPLAKADGTPCDDGLWCTVGNQCTGGVCSGAARDCSAEGDQ